MTGQPRLRPAASAAATFRWALLFLIVLVVFAPAICGGPGGDFEWWGQSAERLLATGRIEMPHFLFPLLLASLGSFARRYPGFPWNWTTAGIALALAFKCLEAIILTHAIRARIGGEPTTPSFAMAAFAALALMLVAPVSIFTSYDQNLYLGYIGINVYHNPTMFALKPLALWTWLRLDDLVEGRRPYGWREVSGLALGVVVMTLAKPSYTIVLVPGLAVFAAWQAWQGRWGVLAPLAVGVGLPAAAILLWQFSFTYSADGSGIQWAPLLVMRGHPPLSLAGRLALSVAFPATLAALYRRQALASAALRLAWLVFAAGAAVSYLLAERGPRALHGNFLWSGQVALFVLFVTSALVLLEEVRRRPALSGRLAVCVAVLGLHLASGLWFVLHPRWW